MGKRRIRNVDRVVANCEERFRFKCPQKWEELAPTDEADVRFCGECRKNVYFCRTGKEMDRRASEGKCVAIDFEQPVVGMMQVDYGNGRKEFE